MGGERQVCMSGPGLPSLYGACSELRVREPVIPSVMDYTSPRSQDHLCGSTSELVEFWERNSTQNEQFYGGTPRKSMGEEKKFTAGSQNESNLISTNFNITDMEENSIFCNTDSFSPLEAAKVRESLKRKYSPANSEGSRTPVKVTKTSSIENPRIRKTLVPKVVWPKSSIYNTNKNTTKRSMTCTSRPATSHGLDRFKDAPSPSYKTPRRPKKKTLQIVGDDIRFVYLSPITGMKRLEKPSPVTKPKPFSFYMRDMTKESPVKEEKQPGIQFKARAPTVLRKEPFWPDTRPRRIINFSAPNLRTEYRATKWNEIRLEQEKKIRETEMELRKVEEETIRQIRKTQVFKASGIAWKK